MFNNDLKSVFLGKKAFLKKKIRYLIKFNKYFLKYEKSISLMKNHLYCFLTNTL